MSVELCRTFERFVAHLSPSDPVENAAELFLKYDINRIPVVRDGRPGGIDARRDLVRLMLRSRKIARPNSE
ncbi:MAG: CBS domain-containing protein [Pyrinomonadaceae bacterium]